MLDFLKQSGHPYYQFYDDPSSYNKRCIKQLGIQGVGKHIKLSFKNDSKIPRITDLRRKIHAQKSLKNSENMTEDEDIEFEEEVQYIKNDPVRKMQFDHNVSTCLTNKFPEMLVDDDGKEIIPDDFSFAPGEGKTPINFLNEKDWDIKAWPSLHPDGKYGLHHKRNIKLSDQKYFVHRIRNKDRRFEENSGYVFASTAYVELKQI